MDTELIASIRRTRMCSAYLVLSFLLFFPCRGADVFSFQSDSCHAMSCISRRTYNDFYTSTWLRVSCLKFSLIGACTKSSSIDGVTAGVSKRYSGRPSFKDEDVLCLPGLFFLYFFPYRGADMLFCQADSCHTMSCISRRTYNDFYTSTWLRVPFTNRCLHEILLK